MDQITTDALYDIYLQHPSVCIDSREVQAGDLFVALPGENTDGNRYALSALEKGAAVALVSDPKVAASNDRCLYCTDTLAALQQLAKRHRSSVDIPVIAITGSNGKTTTKELCATILEKRYRVLHTEGNYNNQLGMPLTLLRLRPKHEIAVIEVGINHPGEMELLADIVRPTHTLITGIGKAHLEGFRTLQGTLREKSILAERAYSAGGTVFLNADDPLLRERWGEKAQVSYGLEERTRPIHPNYVATILREQPTLSLRIKDQEGESVDITTQLVGLYNYHNVLAAFAVGVTFGIPFDEIAEAVESYTPSNDRSQVVHLPRNISVIMDAYNANPSSMRAALDNLFRISGHNKFAILGDMLELGASTDEEHATIMRLMDKHPEITTLYVGETFSRLAGLDVEKMTFPTVLAARAFLEVIQIPDDSIWLLKGSRLIALEKLLPALREKADKEVSDGTADLFDIDTIF